MLSAQIKHGFLLTDCNIYCDHIFTLGKIQQLCGAQTRAAELPGAPGQTFFYQAFASLLFLNHLIKTFVLGVGGFPAGD